jgi:hypothetical protein
MKGAIWRCCGLAGDVVLWGPLVWGFGVSVALERPMSLDGFLAWEEKEEPRWEYDGFAAVAMTGGTSEHRGDPTQRLYRCRQQTAWSAVPAIHL